MPLEIGRLLLGLLVIGLHRHIADFVLERERSLALNFRHLGFFFTTTMSIETAHNLYFGIGLFMVLVELLRIYQIAH